ncbi:hypothetical protein [Nocardia sp. NPDC057030]|uniref:hypothetical protein n=1 Tax=unclassified Nocardia TaxID=2637762 RepID=UPI003636BC8C
MILGTDTKVLLLVAGLIFLWALLLGAWKYRQIVVSPEHQAHPYVSIAHRAALLYSFAVLLIAVFVELSDWPTAVNLIAAAVLLPYFVIAIATYVWHGWRQDTDNQLRNPVRGTGVYMVTLIIGEIGGFLVLLAGFVHGQLL